MQCISGLTNQLADCLSHLGGQKDTIKLPSCMLTRLQISFVPEVIAFNKLELLHKKMMSLHCSSKPSHKDGQTISKKFPVLYSLIGLMCVCFSFCLIAIYMTLWSNFLKNRINFVLKHKLLPYHQQRLLQVKMFTYTTISLCR